MKKVIFCIITVGNLGTTYVVTSEESEKNNIDLAMEKDAVVSERTEIETEFPPRSFLRKVLDITENALFGFDGGFYGDISTDESKNGFKSFVESLQQKLVPEN
jgi:hypothetical protein